MNSSVYYVLRSQTSGNYLTAHPSANETAYLLVFQEHYDALSYLNSHGSDVAQQFQVETLATQKLRGVLARWQLHGVGLVQDPMPPQIEFLQVQG